MHDDIHHVKLLLVLFSVFVSSLGCITNVRSPGETTSVISDIADETVALITNDEEGDTRAFCTGVWISKDVILTQAHCAVAAARYSTLMDDDEAIPVVKGTIATYIVQSETNEMFEVPTKTHSAFVQAYDIGKDIAILKAVDSIPHHKVATLARYVPSVGQPLHVIGHSRGIYWTYMPGVVAGFHTHLKFTAKVGPFIQITAPISAGMSGGGAFDVDGRLIGTISFTANNATDVAFLVHHKTIREFLKANHVE